jgi:hypothetical protein
VTADAVRSEPEGIDPAARPWVDLRSSGLLWLVNAAVFHPRGFALAVVEDGGKPVGWRLLGDGREPWSFASGDSDESFRAAEATLTAQRIPTGEGDA